MSDFSSRLVEERKRLGCNQSEFGVLGGVTKDSQLNYEKGTRRPDVAYLEALKAHGVDVVYLVTGMRLPVTQYPTAVSVTVEAATPRYVTREEAALLDNYEAADEQGRAAARSVLDALAKQKAA